MVAQYCISILQIVWHIWSLGFMYIQTDRSPHAALALWIIRTRSSSGIMMVELSRYTAAISIKEHEEKDNLVSPFVGMPLLCKPDQIDRRPR